MNWIVKEGNLQKTSIEIHRKWIECIGRWYDTVQSKWKVKYNQSIREILPMKTTPQHQMERQAKKETESKEGGWTDRVSESDRNRNKKNFVVKGIRQEENLNSMSTIGMISPVPLLSSLPANKSNTVRDLMQFLIRNQHHMPFINWEQQREREKKANRNFHFSEFDSPSCPYLPRTLS